MANKNLEIDHQYQLYLKRMGLDEDKMHPQQKVETKRAFMGGCAQMLALMFDDIADIEDENKAVLTLEDLNIQLQQYWKDQLTQHNKKP